jgi:hypothetical protein
VLANCCLTLWRLPTKRWNLSDHFAIKKKLYPAFVSCVIRVGAATLTSLNYWIVLWRRTKLENLIDHVQLRSRDPALSERYTAEISMVQLLRAKTDGIRTDEWGLFFLPYFCLFCQSKYNLISSVTCKLSYKRKKNMFILRMDKGINQICFKKRCIFYGIDFSRIYNISL